MRMRKLILTEQDERDGVVWYLLRNEIITCKDCKYWADGTCEMLGTVHMTADDFCSRGEKR